MMEAHDGSHKQSAPTARQQEPEPSERGRLYVSVSDSSTPAEGVCAS